MNKTLSIALMGFMIAGCSTSTKTAGAYKNLSNVAAVGGAIAGGVPLHTEYTDDGASTAPNLLPINLQKTPHQINISGIVLCEISGFINFKKLRVDIYDGTHLSSSLNVDSHGKYGSTFRAKEGLHSARLVGQLNGEVLDTKTFHSSAKTDRFTVNLTGCPQ